MTTTRRIIHHAGWFALLGPSCAGLPVAIISIVAIALQYHESPGVFLRNIVSMLPFLLIVTWLIGALPALLTGIAVACLPTYIYAFHYRRTLASAAIGLGISVMAAILSMLLFTDRDLLHFILNEEVFWIFTGSGLLAGVVMGLIIPWLPPRVAPRQ